MAVTGTFDHESEKLVQFWILDLRSLTTMI